MTREEKIKAIRDDLLWIDTTWSDAACLRLATTLVDTLTPAAPPAREEYERAVDDLLLVVSNLLDSDPDEVPFDRDDKMFFALGRAFGAVMAVRAA